MDSAIEVKWTERSLLNVLDIKAYLKVKFTEKEVVKFEGLKGEFENIISNFHTLYPESESQKPLLRAVIHKKQLYITFSKRAGYFGYWNERKQTTYNQSDKVQIYA